MRTLGRSSRRPNPLDSLPTSTPPTLLHFQKTASWFLSTSGLPVTSTLRKRAKYVFEPKTIPRVELLVLSILNWRLKSITPFSSLGFFSLKVDLTGIFVRVLVSRATEAILSNIKGCRNIIHRALPRCNAVRSEYNPRPVGQGSWGCRVMVQWADQRGDNELLSIDGGITASKHEDVP
ncbi:hypothetical protein MLD38_040399 [Melastoma candidum]|uniref:Uncharacterized protein n=1 Tax=Melastoma candidum TaxID=119954 RepID=A0ACB9L535_9MYRT|nr:hypothetical protein MLD38_040399 [Melastoma candidum]